MDIEALESKYAELRQAYESKEIDSDEFQSAVDELRIQDEYNRYWMIGAESGTWYYYDGNEWTQADPHETDRLPFIDEEGVYWMLGEDTDDWYYFDGEEWVLPAEAGTMAVEDDPYASYPTDSDDDTEYYQDDQGRYWTIGKQSGEWYFYDEYGWHRADELTDSEPFHPRQVEQMQPVSQPPGQHTVPFQPIQTAPSYAQAGSPQTPQQDYTQPYQPQQPYQPGPVSMGGYPPPQPGPTPYTQPVNPQPQPPPQPYQQPGYSEPVARQQPYQQPGYSEPPPPQQPPPQPYQQPGYSEPVARQQLYQQPGYSEPPPPQQPYHQPPPAQPVDEFDAPERGVWLYFDGERWLRYDDPEQVPEGAETRQVDEYYEDDPYLDDEDYFEPDDEDLEDEKILEIDDLDDFVEVVEVDEEDIIDLEEETVEAEFQVEIIKPGQEKSSTSPVEPVAQTATAAPVADETGTTAFKTGPTGQVSQPARQQPQTGTIPRTTTPQSGEAGFTPQVVPAWLWTSIGGVLLLLIFAVVLVGIRLAVSNQQQVISTVLEAATPTLPGVAPGVTPTVGPTPSPTATVPPTATAVPLGNFSSDYFGFSLDYPAGWVYQENDDQVVFAPSTRALDNSSLNGAALWVTFTENSQPADQTDLLANGLERFSPILETLSEGNIEIGDDQWISAQVRFDSAEMGEEAIALVAATVRNEVGYTLVAVAPAAEWEDFIPLFRYPVNSFAFQAATPEEAVAQADEPVSSGETGGRNSGSGDDSAAASPGGITPRTTATRTPSPSPTPEAAANNAEPLVYTIVAGDTLLAIAVRFDVSTAELVEANNLGSADAILRIGQELVIPQEGVEIAAAATPTSKAAETPATDDEEATATATPAADEAEATAAPTVAATPTSAPETTAAEEAPAQPASLSGKIAYPGFSTDINSFDIWLSNIDGSDPEIIAINASQPKFSRDGQRLAYRSWEPSLRGIYFIDYSSGRQGLLTKFIEDALPTWAPDGQITFTSRREGDRVPRIFRVDQDGNDYGLGFIAEYVDTLADGRLVARGCTVSGDCGVWVLLPDASGEVKISGDTSTTAPAAHPTDPNKFTFMSFDRDGANNWEIWTMNTDGSNAQRLTEDPANDGLPTWSPDGQSIAFVSDRGGVWGIWAMNADGSNQRRLFNMQGSPNGQVLHDVPNSKGWLEERITWIP